MVLLICFPKKKNMGYVLRCKELSLVFRLILPRVVGGGLVRILFLFCIMQWGVLMKLRLS